MCAAIVVGIVGEYVNYIDAGHGYDDPKIIYTLALGSLSILFSLLLTPPFMYAFWAFPLDLIFFFMWMVSFGLLEDVSPPRREK